MRQRERETDPRCKTETIGSINTVIQLSIIGYINLRLEGVNVLSVYLPWNHQQRQRTVMEMKPPGSGAKCVIWLWSSSDHSKNKHFTKKLCQSIHLRAVLFFCARLTLTPPPQCVPFLRKQRHIHVTEKLQRNLFTFLKLKVTFT